MKKTLPIAPPPVYGYLHHAFPLSIMATRDDYLPWFHSHFLQLSCPADLPVESIAHDRACKLDFFIHPLYTIEHPHYNQFISPCLNSAWLDWRLLAAGGADPVLFLVDCIARDLYVELSVDMYYVRESAAYGRRHMAHEVVVYGYDTDARTFDVEIGFDRKGAFAAIPIPFDELSRAVAETDLSGHYIERGIGLLEYLDDGRCAFDPAAVRAQLDDYYHSRDSRSRHPAAPAKRRHLFGCAVYSFLYQYLDYLSAHAAPPDIRPVHLLWEHKKCLCARVELMEREGYFDPALGLGRQCAELARQAAHLRLVMLRNLRRRDPASAGHISDGIKAIEKSERTMLETLLARLDQVLPALPAARPAAGA